MAKPQSELDAIRAYVTEQTPLALSRRTKISRRTLHYLKAGKVKPTYPTLLELRRDMAKIGATIPR